MLKWNEVHYVASHNVNSVQGRQSVPLPAICVGQLVKRLQETVLFPMNSILIVKVALISSRLVLLLHDADI